MTVDYTKLGAAIGGVLVIFLQSVNLNQSEKIERLDESIGRTEFTLNKQILEVSKKLSLVQDQQNIGYHDQITLMQNKLDVIQKELEHPNEKAQGQ